jgi:hypothetical protein
MTKKAATPQPEAAVEQPQVETQVEPTSMTIEVYESLLATGWQPPRGAAIYPAKNLVVI